MPESPHELPVGLYDRVTLWGCFLSPDLSVLLEGPFFCPQLISSCSSWVLSSFFLSLLLSSRCYSSNDFYHPSSGSLVPSQAVSSLLSRPSPAFLCIFSVSRPFPCNLGPWLFSATPPGKSIFLNLHFLQPHAVFTLLRVVEGRYRICCLSQRLKIFVLEERRVLAGVFIFLWFVSHPSFKPLLGYKYMDFPFLM